MNTISKPELLIPVGNLEKLQTAVFYGADAVYLGGQKFGLRSAADNFSLAEIALGTTFAHKHNCKVYITLNSFLHDNEMISLKNYITHLEKSMVDAVIVSDIGAIDLIRQLSSVPIHLSTQASCLNSQSAQYWKSLGIKRIILGREISIKEAKAIKKVIEIEMFVHGAMCSAYAGHCSISNYTAGRDSNRGGCKQSCRFPYKIDPKNKANATHTQLMSSKDLCGINVLPDFIEAGIDSLKVEGRMKSSLYIATTAKIYRKAIDSYLAGKWNEKLLQKLRYELEKIPHRNYYLGHLRKPENLDSICLKPEMHSACNYEFLGSIKHIEKNKMLVYLKNDIYLNEEFEVLPFNRLAQQGNATKIHDVLHNTIDHGTQERLIWLPLTPYAKVSNVLRKKKRKNDDEV